VEHVDRFVRWGGDSPRYRKARTWGANTDFKIQPLFEVHVPERRMGTNQGEPQPHTSIRYLGPDRMEAPMSTMFLLEVVAILAMFVLVISANWQWFTTDPQENAV
jgi:hypothetical protein